MSISAKKRSPETRVAIYIDIVEKGMLLKDAAAKYGYHINGVHKAKKTVCFLIASDEEYGAIYKSLSRSH